jgi:hypothetical protein
MLVSQHNKGCQESLLKHPQVKYDFKQGRAEDFKGCPHILSSSQDFIQLFLVSDICTSEHFILCEDCKEKMRPGKWTVITPFCIAKWVQ